MNAAVKHTIRIATGILFLVLGIAGLFLPILQGILFIIIGLVLLAPYSPFIRRQLQNFRDNHPHLYNRAHAFKEAMKRKIKRTGSSTSDQERPDF